MGTHWYKVRGLEYTIDPQALSILNYLRGEQLIDGIENCYMSVNTSPWYNGRECGICLETVVATGRESLIITFGEHRNSDAIFVDCWEADRSRLNPPTVSDFTDEAYANRRYFNAGAVLPAKEFILDCIESFVLKASKSDDSRD
jgi:hypothetical protein